MLGVLRELTGPSLVSPLPGWWLEIDRSVPGSGADSERAWQSFRIAYPARVERLLPGLCCPLPETPVDCCVVLARRLVSPIRLHSRLIPNPADPRSPARRALVRSGHHALVGEALGLALAILRRLLQPAALPGRQAEGLRQAAERMQQRAQVLTSNAFTNAVIDHAAQRGLPVQILHEQLVACPVLQIGVGSRSRIVASSCLDSDSYIGGHACQNKAFSQQILRRLGYRVPRHRQLPRHASPAQLMAAAQLIGYPCVLKPMDGALGAGVSIDIRDQAALVQAAGRASEVARAGLLLEEQVPGDYHRLVVIEGVLVSVICCQPPHLTGDGQRSIRAILAEPNPDSTRPGALLCDGPAPTLSESVLRQLQAQGWTPDDVPAAGVRVVLRCDLIDREDWVCQSVLKRVDQSLHRLAEGIAKAFGMANVGIDVLSPDITEPAASRQLWVIEVNAIQRLHPCMAPLALRTIFPDAEAARVPVSVVVCAEESSWPDASTWQHLISRYPGHALALPARLGERLDPALRLRLEQDRPMILYAHPREALLNRCVHALLFVIDWQELSQSGLPAISLDQLQLLGEPPSGMARSWSRLMATVAGEADDRSSCFLPDWVSA